MYIKKYRVSNAENVKTKQESVKKNEAEIAVISTPSLRREKSEKKIYVSALLAEQTLYPFQYMGTQITHYLMRILLNYVYLHKIEIK